MNARTLMIVAALICFILAMFGVDIGSISLGWAGLAFYMVSKLVSGSPE